MGFFKGFLPTRPVFQSSFKRYFLRISWRILRHFRQYSCSHFWSYHSYHSFDLKELSNESWMDLFNNFSFSQFVVDFLLNDWSIPIPFWLNSNGPFEQMSLSSEEETSTKFAFSPDSVNVWFSVRWLHCFCSFILSAWTSATLNSAIYVQSLNQRRSAPSYFHLTHWNVNKPTHFFIIFFFFIYLFFFYNLLFFCRLIGLSSTSSLPLHSGWRPKW